MRDIRKGKRQERQERQERQHRYTREGERERETLPAVAGDRFNTFSLFAFTFPFFPSLIIP